MRVDEVLEVLDTYKEWDRYTALVLVMLLVCFNVTSLRNKDTVQRGRGGS